MNIFVLLLSLLSPYFSPSAQNESVPAALFTVQPQVVLAFEHSLGFSPYIESFESLAGVSLYMPEEELLRVKGTPLAVTPDPWQECLEYVYADVSAGICNGLVLYVHVTPEQAGHFGLQLNEWEINPAQDNIRELLGSPDFVAEDGDVYLRGNDALKIYRNAQTGEWEGIDLFDGSSS